MTVSSKDALISAARLLVNAENDEDFRTSEIMLRFILIVGAIEETQALLRRLNEVIRPGGPVGLKKREHMLLGRDVPCKCDRHRDTSCPICDGGLASCTVCGGAEITLTTECCGYRLTELQRDSVAAGTLNFVNGEWISPKEGL